MIEPTEAPTLAPGWMFLRRIADHGIALPIGWTLTRATFPLAPMVAMFRDQPRSDFDFNAYLDIRTGALVIQGVPHDHAASSVPDEILRALTVDAIAHGRPGLP